MLHPSISRSIEEIESALFSDDTFACTAWERKYSEVLQGFHEWDRPSKNVE